MISRVLRRIGKPGDSEEELKTEDQYEYERIEERKARPIPKAPNGEDPSQWMAHAAAFSGPTMVFCKLNSTLEDGSKRTKDDTDLTGARWKELLLMGGVEATPYSIEYDTVLLTLQRGWNGAQLRDFCLEQPEVVKASWDQIDYFPERLQSKEGSGLANKKKPKGKGGKKKDKKKGKKKERRKRKKKGKIKGEGKIKRHGHGETTQAEEVMSVRFFD